MHRCLALVAKLASFNVLATKALHVLVGFLHLNVLPRFTRLALFLPEVTTFISPFLNNLPRQIYCLRERLSTCTRGSIGRGLISQVYFRCIMAYMVVSRWLVLRRMPLTHVLKRYKQTANKVRSAYRETQGKYVFFRSVWRMEWAGNISSWFSQLICASSRHALCTYTEWPHIWK